MNYSDKINGFRLRESSNEDVRSVDEELESDRSRIVFSSPFRRLQRKAQVFSLESNAAVQSRLTHSIEVSQMGRYIAQQILKKLKSKVHELKKEEENAFVTIVENACLIHDIGNPPFGHFGESAIREWFEGKGRERLERYLESGCEKYLSEEYLDFTRFDGNPQGVRIICKLQGDGGYGFNLTASQIAASMKYVYCASERRKGNCNFGKKPGYFSTEKNCIDQIRKRLGIEEGCRHPSVYIMEAADDIAYCLSDIEDAIEKKVLCLDDFKSFLEEHKCNDILGVAYDQAKKKEFNGRNFLTFFRVKFVADLVVRVVDIYVKNHEYIFKGEYGSLIGKDQGPGVALEKIKDFVKKNVYQAPEAERIEVAGSRVVRELLNTFGILLSLERDEFRSLIDKKPNSALAYHFRLVNIIGESMKKEYVRALENIDSSWRDDLDDKTYEWHLRAHLIVDFISGMTDHFALETYQLTSGISMK